ncbi:MAG TPA: YncE family protein, partial [Candidatus Sulfotelmatobacter sp.]|nr:YncE family protein [Candidatus Sulfotelmatobacter sp.]
MPLPPKPASFRMMARLVGVVTVALLAVAARPTPKRVSAVAKERYLSPIEIAISPDGHLLYVVCQDSNEVRVIETAAGTVVKSIPVGRVPRGIALSPDGNMLYVTNAWSDNVSVIDTKAEQAIRTLSTGFEPTGVALDSRHNVLYVANRLSNDISVIDLKTDHETKRLLAGRGASYLSSSPDGKLIYCTHIYPNPGAFRSQPNSEITVIDTESQTVMERKPLPNVSG